MPSIQKFIDAMRWAADSDKVGYDQGDRTTVEFYSDRATESDCSWLIIAALRYAGFETGGATYTGNMAEELCKHGWRRVANDGNPQPGDILLNHVNHVAAWLGDCLAQASIDENGNIAGGRAGDQTGDEVNTRGYYNFPWNCYLRWAGESDAGSAKPAAAKPSAKPPTSPEYRIFREGKWRQWKSDGATAGTAAADIYDMDFRYLGPNGWFALTLEGGEELPKNKHNDGHAKKVIGVTVYYDTAEPEKTGYYEAVYRVYSGGRWLKWEHDDEDGGAGDDRNPVRRLQLKIAQCG